MAIVAHVILPGITKEQYDQVREAVGWLDEAPVGGLSHLTWWEDGDCHNCDAWESEGTFNDFAQDRLGRAWPRRASSRSRRSRSTLPMRCTPRCR
jgi:hypothetical protein